jgi:hypothetical protein
LLLPLPLLLLLGRFWRVAAAQIDFGLFDSSSSTAAAVINVSYSGGG